MFITIVMTGLDQDQMQKNLTIRTLKDAQKNVVSYGLAFAPINFLFLCLGVLLLVFAHKIISRCRRFQTIFCRYSRANTWARRYWEFSSWGLLLLLFRVLTQH